MLKTRKILINQHPISRCEVTDFYCQLKNSIIVWNDKIIHDCPYSLINKIDLERMGNILTNKSQGKLFQIQEKITIRNNLTALKSADGFILTNNLNSKKRKLFKLIYKHFIFRIIIII